MTNNAAEAATGRPENSEVLIGMIRRSKPFLLLAAMAAEMIAGGIYQNEYVELATNLAIIVAAVYLASDTRRHFLVTMGFAIPGALLVIIGNVTESREVSWAAYPFLLALYLQLIRLMLHRITRAKVVTVDTIGLALCTYVLLGYLWVMFYIPVAALDPAAFSSNTPGEIGQGSGALLYFSYVTLTTLGYGDILPVSPLARALAALEALTGVLFLAVLISQLVGRYGKGRR